MATVVDTIQVKFEALGDQFERETNRLFGPRGLLIAASAAAAAAVVAAMAKMAGNSVKEFASFEHSMAGAFRNIGNTSEEMEADLIAGVRSIATQYGVSATEIAEALAEYAYAGLEVEDALWSVEQATRGAIAADSDLMDTLNKMEGIWAAFKGQGYEVEDVMDVLTAMASNAVGGFEALSDAIVGATAPAMNAGLSLEELGAAIGALTWLSVPASEASTRIRTALQELNDSGTIVGGLFKELSGVTFKQFIAAGGTLEEALTLLNNNLEDGKDISQLFGSSIAGNAISMIAAGEGADYYLQILDALEDSTGATDAAFERMSGTINSKGATIRSLFQEMSIALGERLAPAVHTVMDAVIEAFPRIQESVVRAFDRIGEGVQAVINWWQSLVANTDTNWSAALALTESFQAAMGKVFELLGLLWTGVLMPIWDGIAPHLEGIWNGVVGIVQGAWEVINGILDVVIGFLTGDWERAWDGMRAMLDGLWTAVVGVIEVAWSTIDGILNAGINLLRGPLTVAWQYWQDVALSVWASVSTVTTEAWDAIRGVLNTAVEFLQGVFSDSWTALTTLVTKAWEGITSVITDQWAAVTGVLNAAMEFLAATFTPAWEALKPALQAVWTGISALVSSAWEDVKTLLQAAMQFVTGDFTGAWATLTGFYESLMSSIETTLAVGWDAVKSMLVNIWDGIAASAGTAWGAVVGAILSAFDGMVGTLSGIWEGVVSIVTDAINSVISMINGLLDSWNSLSFEIPTIEIPEIEIFNPFGDNWVIGGTTFGGGTVSVPQIPTIPLLAQGGIVDAATLAVLGEAGPEAVIPLDRLDSMLSNSAPAGQQTIIVELDGQKILQAVAPRLVDQLRVRTGIRGI